MGFIPYPMHELHSSARELGAHPPLGVPARIKIAFIKQPPTTLFADRDPKTYTYTVCFRRKSVVILKPKQNRSEKNSAKIL